MDENIARGWRPTLSYGISITEKITVITPKLNIYVFIYIYI